MVRRGTQSSKWDGLPIDEGLSYIALSVADDVHLMRSGKVILSEKAEGLDLDRLHDLYFAREGAKEGAGR